MNRLHCFLSVLVLTAGAGAGWSQKPGNANRLASDNKFVMEAAQGGMAEVEMGNLAVQHASNDQVKKFGQRMVTDHSKANDQLKKVVASKGVTIPTEVDPKQKATMEKLAKLSGAEFDRAYMQDMVKDHREDISEFKKEASSGDDPDIKMFASQTLPTLEDHLKMAEQINSQIK